ncbi:unnamed protein product [Jaminaea pallidilutea]
MSHNQAAPLAGPRRMQSYHGTLQHAPASHPDDQGGPQYSNRSPHSPSTQGEPASSITGYHVRARVSRRATQSKEYWSSVKGNAKQSASDLGSRVRQRGDDQQGSRSPSPSRLRNGPGKVTRPSLTPLGSSSDSRGSKHSFSTSILPTSIASSASPAPKDVVHPVLLPGYTFLRIPKGSHDGAEPELHIVLRGFVVRKAAVQGRGQRMFNLMARQLARLPKPLSASSTSLLLQTQPSSLDDANFFPSVPQGIPQTAPEAAEAAAQHQPLSERIIEGVAEHVDEETLGKLVEKIGALPIDGAGGTHDESGKSASDDQKGAGGGHHYPVHVHRDPSKRHKAPPELTTDSKDLENDLRESVDSMSVSPQTPSRTSTFSSESSSSTQPSAPPSRISRIKGMTPLASASQVSIRSAPGAPHSAAKDSQLVGGSEFWARRTLDEVHELTANLNQRLTDFWIHRVADRRLRIEVQGEFEEAASRGDNVDSEQASQWSTEWRTLLAQDLTSDNNGMYRLKVNMGPVGVFGEKLTSLRCRAVLSEDNDNNVVVHPETDWSPLHLPPYRQRSSPNQGPQIRLISDIDDTVRLTNVTSGLKNVFRQVFILPHSETAVPGMSDWYHGLLRHHHVGMHFVSNAPVELWKSVCGFLEEAGMPRGMHLHLKSYNSEREGGVSNPSSTGGYGTDEEDKASGTSKGNASAGPPTKTSLLSTWLQPASQRKRAAIVSILDDFPDSLFLLVGDTGELDLELYADLAKERPHQVKALYLRDVSTPTSTNVNPNSSMINVQLSPTLRRPGSAASSALRPAKDWVKAKKPTRSATTSEWSQAASGSSTPTLGPESAKNAAGWSSQPSSPVKVLGIRSNKTSRDGGSSQSSTPKWSWEDGGGGSGGGSMEPTYLSLDGRPQNNSSSGDNDTGGGGGSGGSGGDGDGSAVRAETGPTQPGQQGQAGASSILPALQIRMNKARSLLPPGTELHLFRRGDDGVQLECERLVQSLQRGSASQGR